MTEKRVRKQILLPYQIERRHYEVYGAPIIGHNNVWKGIASPVQGFDSNIIGTSNYEDTKDSDIVVITAGIARKPGMSRDDLVQTNQKVMKSVTQEIVKYSPNCYIIVLTNR